MRRPPRVGCAAPACSSSPLSQPPRGASGRCRPSTLVNLIDQTLGEVSEPAVTRAARQPEVVAHRERVGPQVAPGRARPS